MKHILIVEDEKFIADLYKSNLEESGYAVSIASDGAKALTALRRRRPDILLLDLLLPGTDGFAVLEWIKEQPKHAGKYPVIVITNLSQKLSHEKCTKLGATVCIVKSDIDIDDLIAIVKKSLRKDSPGKH